MTKTCCRVDCGRGPLPLSEFGKAKYHADGLRYECKVCCRKYQKAQRARRVRAPDEFEITVEETPDPKAAAQARRLGSDFAQLRPEDFDVSVGNVGKTDGKAAAEKRQEYNARMGEFAEAVRESGGDPAQIPEELGSYIGGLAEQERRFSNRRLARTVSITAAHAELARQLFKQTAAQYFSKLITPTGYALKGPGTPKSRTVCLQLSDLHLGANLDARGNPIPYRAIEEARRFEYVVRNVLDYKTDHRDESELLVLLNGDVIEGLLLHDQRAGLPLTEQKAVFWHHLSRALALFAQTYPRVRVSCQPGNHGRNIARHPGRATEDKWDGIEWDLYYALSLMCSNLPNVSFDMPFQAVSVVDAQGHKFLQTHGDTEVKLGDPDTKAKENAATFDQINATLLYGVKFDFGVTGHFHKCRINDRWLHNGCLVPPNGHARGAGYFGERCCQLLWETTEDFAIGDLRRIFVGPEQDTDERLGQLIPPFRFKE